MGIFNKSSCEITRAPQKEKKNGKKIPHENYEFPLHSINFSLVLPYCYETRGRRKEEKKEKEGKKKTGLEKVNGVKKNDN